MLRYTALLARPALALAAASAALVFAAPAMATTAAEAPTVRVHLNAADLSARDASSSVHARIAIAARSVCAADGRTLQEQMIARQCFAKAVRSGEGQLVALREQAKGREQVLASASR